MNPIQYLIHLLQDPRTAIAGWISMGVTPTLGIIFLIVFIETGVVFFPFLPGDSLLFAAGFFAAPDATTGVSALPLSLLLPVVWSAPIIGDQCNYWIGHFFGRRIIESGKVKALTPERLAKTEGMIEKWGPLAVFLGRFFPFIRTFMPFISGISGMRWSRFTPFSVLGGLAWSSLFTLLGYFFGGVPFVQKHFEWVIVFILLISVIPAAVGAVKAWLAARKKKGEPAEAAGAKEDAPAAAAVAAPEGDDGDEASGPVVAGVADGVPAEAPAQGAGLGNEEVDAEAFRRVLADDDASVADAEPAAASPVAGDAGAGEGAAEGDEEDGASAPHGKHFA